MLLTFEEYCLSEMAQSRDAIRATVELDNKDRDFIKQAMEANPKITPVNALRTRYTLLLQDKPGEAGKVRFFGERAVPWYYADIQRTHLEHLQKKLRKLGLDDAAENGMAPNDEALNHVEHKAKFYDKAFGRQNASDAVKQGFFQVNQEKGGTAVMMPKIATRSIDEPESASPNEDQDKTKKPKTERTVLKPVPYDWAIKHTWPEMDKLHSITGTGMYDFSDVWEDVKTLVGNTANKEKYIRPDVWSIFKKNLPNAGHVIYSGIRTQLSRRDPDALRDPMTIKQYMAQTTATLLARPPIQDVLKDNKDILARIEYFFTQPAAIHQKAQALTLQIMSKWSGIDRWFFARKLNADTHLPVDSGDLIGKQASGREYSLTKNTSKTHYDVEHDEFEEPSSVTKIRPEDIKAYSNKQKPPAERAVFDQSRLKAIQSKVRKAKGNPSVLDDDEYDIWQQGQKKQEAVLGFSDWLARKTK